MSIRVLLADDQELVRTGLAAVLSGEPDMEVAGEAADGRQAIDAARRLRPDVVVMDVRMPHVDGLAATRAILADPSAASTRVVVLTTFDLDEYVYEALESGASGFLVKDMPVEQIATAIRVVHEGQAMIAPSATRRLIESTLRGRGRRPPPPGLDELTPREREVLLHLARGRSNAEIASAFVLSEGTVKTHVGRVLMKLGLRDRVQAVVLAYECGLIVPGEDS